MPEKLDSMRLSPLLLHASASVGIRPPAFSERCTPPELEKEKRSTNCRAKLDTASGDAASGCQVSSAKMSSFCLPSRKSTGPLTQRLSTHPEPTIEAPGLTGPRLSFTLVWSNHDLNTHGGGGGGSRTRRARSHTRHSLTL